MFPDNYSKLTPGNTSSSSPESSNKKMDSKTRIQEVLGSLSTKISVSTELLENSSSPTTNQALGSAYKSSRSVNIKRANKADFKAYQEALAELNISSKPASLSPKQRTQQSEESEEPLSDKSTPSAPKSKQSHKQDSKTAIGLSSSVEKDDSTLENKNLLIGKIDDQPIYFERVEVLGDGNCGVTGIGARDRKDLVDTLLTLANHRESREALYEEIYQAFLFSESNIRPFSDEWKNLLDKKNEIQNEWDHLIRELRSIFSEAANYEGNQSTELIRWLEEHHQQEWADKLKAKNLEVYRADDALRIYCCKKEVYTYYVKSFLSDESRLWVGHASAILFSKAKQNTLFIWELERGTTDHVTLKNKTVASQSHNVIHLFYPRGSFHFELLIEERADEDEIKPIATETSQKVIDGDKSNFIEEKSVSAEESEVLSIENLSFTLSSASLKDERNLELLDNLKSQYQTALNKKDYAQAEKHLERAFILSRRDGLYNETANLILMYYNDILLNPVIKAAVPNLSLIVFSQAYRYARLANEANTMAKIWKMIVDFLQNEHPFKVSDTQLENLLEASQKLSQDLKKIRDKLTSSFTNPETFLSAFEVFNLEMDEVTRSLIAAGRKLMTAPIKDAYAIMILGSAGRGERCQYSDLELAVLVKNNDISVINDFVNLFTWIELIVILIGETALPARFFPFLPSGFSFDSAGNTPLGITQGKEVLYRLIDTPERLARFQAEDRFESFIATSNALLYPRLLCGTKEKDSLFNHYQDEVKKILNPKTKNTSLKTVHAVENMNESILDLVVVGKKDRSPKQQMMTHMLQNLMDNVLNNPDVKITADLLQNPPLELLRHKSDTIAQVTHLFQKPVQMSPKETRAFYFINSAAEDFVPRIGDQIFQKDKLVIKNELYRMFQMILNALAIFYDIPLTNSFEIIEKLSHPPIRISYEADANLKAALTLALFYRVKLQHFYEEEKETIVLSADENSEAAGEYAADKQDMKNLAQIYQILIPFYETAKAFIEKQGKSSEFARKTFFQKDFLTRGKICFQMGDAEQCKHNLLRARDMDSNNPEVEEYLGLACMRLLHFSEAESHFQRAWELGMKSRSKTEQGMFLHNWGELFFFQGDYQQALLSFQKAYDLFKNQQLSTPSEVRLCQQNLAKTSYAIGTQFQEISQNKLAVFWYKTSLDHLEILSSAEEIKFKQMNIYFKLINLFIKSLNIPHYEIQKLLAADLENYVREVTQYYNEISKDLFSTSKEFSSEALQGLENYCFLLFNCSHKNTRNVLCKIPAFLELTSSPEKNQKHALDILNQLIKVFTYSFNPDRNHHLAKFYREIALIHLQHKNSKAALDFLKCETKINKSVQAYVLIATIYKKRKKNSKAQAALNQALSSLPQIPKKHPSYPKILRDMALMYAQLEDLKKAKSLVVEAIHAYETLAESNGKPDFADCFEIWLALLNKEKNKDKEWAISYADYASYIWKKGASVFADVKKIEQATKILEKSETKPEQLGHCYLIQSLMNPEKPRMIQKLLTAAVLIYEKCYLEPSQEKLACFQKLLGVQQQLPKDTESMLLLIYVSEKILLIEKMLFPERYNENEAAFLKLNSTNSILELGDLLNQLKDIQLMIKLGMIFYHHSSVFPAIQCFEKVLLRNPNLRETDATVFYHHLANFYMITGNFIASEKIFKKILSLPSPQIYISYALLLFRQQRCEEGIHFCKQVLDLKDSQETGWNYTQVYLKALPDCLGQQILMSEGGWSLSSKAMAYFLLLYYLENKQLTNSYLSSFAQMVNDENDYDQLLLLGYTYEHEDRTQNALTCFQTALTVNDDGNHLSAEWNIQRLKKTKEEEEEIFGIDTSKMIEQGQKNLAHGLFDNAIACFKDCLLVNNEAEESLNLLIGCAYHAKGNMEAAALYF